MITGARRIALALILCSAIPAGTRAQQAPGPIVHTYAPSGSTQREAARIRRICRWADTSVVRDADALLVVVRSSGPNPLAQSYDNFKWLRDEAHSLLNDSGSLFHAYLYLMRPNQGFEQTAHRSYSADPGDSSGGLPGQLQTNPHANLICMF